MQSRVIEKLESVACGDWNRLVNNDNPFLKHEFLVALERNNCVNEELGWIPRHIAVYDGDELVGAVPMYIKYNSYGEFVFDWSWADACERAGMAYYPKLVASIPYTPVTGPRLLSVCDKRRTVVRHALVEAAVRQAEEIGTSSLHWLFTDTDDTETLLQHGMMQRHHYQFHWHNHQYQDFDDFLAGFSASKRKKVRRERRQVSDAGVSIRLLTGAEITDEMWSIFHRFYCLTFHNRYGYPTLTLDFFREIGTTMGENILLILAYENDECIAGAISFIGGDTLYGRHWGATRNYHSLHFEVCYYSAIDYCIREGLKRYEAGAQGEHKINRGFIPVNTASCHWISNAALGSAIGSFLSWERREIDNQMQALAEHSPYKKQQISG